MGRWSRREDSVKASPVRAPRSPATGARRRRARSPAAAYSSIFGFAADRVIVKPACGEGVVDSGDQRDDGNVLASDGCSATCPVEAGWTCTRLPSVCTL
jgi:cysteine-rich repeat protein